MLALVVLSSLAILLALLAGYVRRVAVDSDQFANRATVALQDDSVRTLIAERVTDDIVLAKESDLIAARPIIESVVSGVVGGRAFTTAFRASVRDVHRAVFDRDQDTFTLAIADVHTLVAAGLQVIRPALAQRVEKESSRVDIAARDIGGVSGTAARAADDVRLLAWLLWVVAVVFVAAALALSTDRRRTVVQLGIGVAVTAILLLVGLGVGRGAVVDSVDGADARAAVGAVWDAFLGDLRTTAWIVAGSGAVVAAAAASLIRPVDARAPLRSAAAWITTEPERRALKAVRGIALVAAGLVFVLATDATVHLLVTLAGVYLIFAGLSAILWLVYQPRPAGGDRSARGVGRVSARRRGVIAAGLAGLLIVGNRGRVRGLRRDDDGCAGGGPVQRAARPVRAAADRRRAARHPQRDVGSPARLVLGRAGSPDSRPAPGRHPGPADRHPLCGPPR